MSTREKILDDVARIAGEAAGFVSDAGRQARESLRTRVDDLATRMDLVPREDFERLEAMLIKAREVQDALEKRVSALEKQAEGSAKKKKV